MFQATNVCQPWTFTPLLHVIHVTFRRSDIVKDGQDQHAPSLVDKQGERMAKKTKMMKCLRHLYPTRRSYAIRTGKRLAYKFTNIMKKGLWSVTEGMWFLQKKRHMETEGKIHFQDDLFRTSYAILTGKNNCRKVDKRSEDLVAKDVPGGWRVVVSSGRYGQGEESSWNLQDKKNYTDDSAAEQKSLGWKLQKDQE